MVDTPTDEEVKLLKDSTPRGLRPHLVEAVEQGHERRVEALLNAGADPNETQGSYHTSLLNVAVARGYVGIAKHLLRCGADPDWTHPPREDGVSHPTHIPALSTACANASTVLVELLLEYGADLERRNYRGETCLFHGVRSRDPRVVELLLTNGAHVDVRNAYGRSPVDEARQWCPQVVERLEEALRTVQPSSPAGSPEAPAESLQIQDSQDREICDRLQEACLMSMEALNLQALDGESSPPASPRPVPSPQEQEDDTPGAAIEHCQSRMCRPRKGPDKNSPSQAECQHEPLRSEVSEILDIKSFSDPNSFADQFFN